MCDKRNEPFMKLLQKNCVRGVCFQASLPPALLAGDTKRVFYWTTLALPAPITKPLSCFFARGKGFVFLMLCHFLIREMGPGSVEGGIYQTAAALELLRWAVPRVQSGPAGPPTPGSLQIPLYSIMQHRHSWGLLSTSHLYHIKTTNKGLYDSQCEARH